MEKWKPDICKYNKKFADDYHFGTGSYGAQNIELFPSLGVAIITICVHGHFKKIQKPITEIERIIQL